MTVEKKEIIEKLAVHEKDTGSAQVQIGLLSERITHLTEHLNIHKKDFSSRRSLLKLAGKRRKLLKYLQRSNPESYKKVLDNLNIRGI